ncbi:hypothetical protein RM190_20145 [Paracoccus sp. CPCC 101403]|uniref:Uncharacterized protein n=1 Tax=Paracoccus broussonetiae TaxID=3075834 RepID=A0ABU3EIW2_9RHOB|nr:hypothetical protein [Paracoccus sp. CPCC 101403]
MTQVMHHDNIPMKAGALEAPMNLASICAARDATPTRMEEGVGALRAA